MVTFHTTGPANGKTCDFCHSPGGSFKLATIVHTGFGSVGNITLPPEYVSCSACHDGTVATGQSTGHLPTAQDCGMCHGPQRGDWLGAAYDHSSLAIVGNASTPACASCHDGSTATGKSVTHVPLPTAGQDCLVCHGTTYISFAMPTFDHAAAGITKNCASCHDGKAHDGVKVISKPTGHIPTSADCSSCHASTANGPGINGSIISGFRRADPFVNTLHPAYTTGAVLATSLRTTTRSTGPRPIPSTPCMPRWMRRAGTATRVTRRGATSWRSTRSTTRTQRSRLKRA